MDQCPTCDHKVERMYDYPILHIESVSRTPTPEYISGSEEIVGLTITKRPFPFWKEITVDNPDIPPRVFEELRTGKKDVTSVNGKIYRKVPEVPSVYRVSEDITAETKAVLKGYFVEKSLVTLESMVGKDISTKEFQKELLIGSTFDVGPHKDGQLHLYDLYESTLENSLSREGCLKLGAGDIYMPHEHIRLFSLELARFKYQGKLRA